MGTNEHPNLGARSRGRRRALYVFAFIVAVPGVVFLWTLILIGIIPPTPSDDVMSLVMLPILFVPFAAFWDNPGEHRTQLERLAEFSYVWLFLSGVTQTTWELPWFVFDQLGWVHNITAADHWLWPWWVYGVADTRYITSNPTIAGLEFCAGFAGPFELYACWLFKKGRRVEANWWALLIGWGLTWATVVFFVAEWHVGWMNIQDGDFGFWVKFVGLNLPWIAAPLGTIPASIKELAYLYEQRGIAKFNSAQAVA